MKLVYLSELPELAGKQFETAEELEVAEAEISEKLAAKKRAADERKADSEVVKEAIVAAHTAKVEAQKAKVEAYKCYLDTIEKLDKVVEEADNDRVKALEAFCTKYPDGFHDTIKLGDVQYDYYYGCKNPEESTESLFDIFSSFFNM